MKAFFTGLFKYNFDTNLKMNTLLQEQSSLEEAQKLLSHITHAQEIWLGRLNDHLPVKSILWETISSEEISGKLHENNEGWNTYLASLSEEDFEKEIEYVNTKVEPFKNKIRDILFHVINHATHHRAQISTLLRKAETAPPTTDYIFYIRE